MFLASPTQRIHTMKPFEFWMLRKLFSNCSVQNCFSFALILNNHKNCKNNWLSKYLLDQSSLENAKRSILDIWQGCKYVYLLWHILNICILNQVKRVHIPINVLHFSLRNSSDEDCICWVKEIFCFFISF